MAKPSSSDCIFFFPRCTCSRTLLALRVRIYYQQGNAAVSSMLGLMCDGGYAEFVRILFPQFTFVTSQTDIVQLMRQRLLKPLLDGAP